MTLVREITNIPDGDPRLDQLAECLRAPQKSNEETPLSMKEVGERLRYHPTWLRRIGVHTHCGIRMAGRRRYRLSEVQKYLQSPECAEAVEAYREVRKNGSNPKSKQTNRLALRAMDRASHTYDLSNCKN
jgi:hypothetical protein